MESGVLPRVRLAQSVLALLVAVLVLLLLLFDRRFLSWGAALEGALGSSLTGLALAALVVVAEEVVAVIARDLVTRIQVAKHLEACDARHESSFYFEHSRVSIGHKSTFWTTVVVDVCSWTEPQLCSLLSEKNDYRTE